SVERWIRADLVFCGSSSPSFQLADGRRSEGDGIGTFHRKEHDKRTESGSTSDCSRIAVKDGKSRGPSPKDPPFWPSSLAGGPLPRRLGRQRCARCRSPSSQAVPVPLTAPPFSPS